MTALTPDVLTAAGLLATLVRNTTPAWVRTDPMVCAAIRVIEDATVRARVRAHVVAKFDGMLGIETGGIGADITVASTEGEVCR